MLEILKVFGQTYVRNHPFVGSARQNPSRVTEGGSGINADMCPHATDFLSRSKAGEATMNTQGVLLALCLASQSRRRNASRLKDLVGGSMRRYVASNGSG
ncbi:hypothetical protein GQ600_8354 [Phytophthora cactorum]|nr:hypothetical protein GQ600_8354 [Phytophthora cactorum]